MIIARTGTCPHCITADVFEFDLDAAQWHTGCGPVDAEACGLPVPSAHEVGLLQFRRDESTRSLSAGTYKVNLPRASDFYCEGVDAFELKGKGRIVTSLSQRKHLREAQGLDPDTGYFREYGEGGEDYN